jgi:hypothetical protein
MCETERARQRETDGAIESEKQLWWWSSVRFGERSEMERPEMESERERDETKEIESERERLKPFILNLSL